MIEAPPLPIMDRLREMRPGEYIFVTDNRGSLVSAVTRLHAELGRKAIKTKRGDGGMHVWRLRDPEG